MSAQSPSEKMIVSMETLQMTIGEISARLSELVGEESYFDFSPFAEGVFVSREYDLKANIVGSKIVVDVAEPICGQPDLEIVPLRDNTKTRRSIALIWEATRQRKITISKVMNSVFTLNSDCLEPKATLKMADIAEACDIHVTTVSRAVSHKICQVASGSVRSMDYFFGSRET